MRWLEDSAMPSHHRLAIAAAPTLILALACGLGSYDEVEFITAQQDHEAVAAGLRGIHAELSAAPQLEIARCPDAAIRTRLEAHPLADTSIALVNSLPTVDYGFLAHLSHGDRDPDPSWDWMRTGFVGGFDGVFLEPEVEDPDSFMGRLERTAAAANSRDRIGEMRAEGYLGVYLPSEARLPKVSGDDFTGGKLSGWLVIYDLNSFERICQAPILARSSDEVEFDPGSVLDDFPQAVQRDFGRAVEQATTESLEMISEQLRGPTLTW